MILSNEFKKNKYIKKPFLIKIIVNQLSEIHYVKIK